MFAMLFSRRLAIVVVTVILIVASSTTTFAKAEWFSPKTHLERSQPSCRSHPAGKMMSNDFVDFFQNFPGFASQRFSALATLDDSKGWVFQLDVPGFSLDEISIHAHGKALTIRGEHKCGKREDPTCIERSVFEEARFPESADLDTAEAELDNGVLHIHVRPKSDPESRGRVVKILDRARGTARGLGESLKQTFTWQGGENGHTNSVQDSVKGLAARYGSEVEDTVNNYIKQFQHKMEVPAEKQHAFIDRVHEKSEDVYRKLKEKIITPNEAYDLLHRNAEDAWKQVGSTAADVREQSELAAKGAVDRARELKDSAETLARDAWESATTAKENVRHAAEHASQYMKSRDDRSDDVDALFSELTTSGVSQDSSEQVGLPGDSSLGGAIRQADKDADGRKEDAKRTAGGIVEGAKKLLGTFAAE